MEKLFDICSDSTPIEEGLTGISRHRGLSRPENGQSRA
jgi:hypothetical protein